MEKENKLQVQQYDVSEVEAKRKKILRKVATGVGAVALTALLSYYGLRGEGSTPANEYLDAEPAIAQDTIPIPTIVQDTILVIAQDTIPPPPPDLPMIEFIMGGNGAWFNSVIEFPKA